MEVINDRAVELTNYEQEAYNRFKQLLDIGKGIVDAAQKTVGEYPLLSIEFYNWLVAS